MTDIADADLAAAHERFSKDCFNRAWDLIVKPDRSAAEDEDMIRLNQASLWHWTQRADCTARNLSIGYWQASRIRAVVGHAGEALRYAKLCLQHSLEQGPFLLGYAEEALGRAALTAGDRAGAERHRERGLLLADAVEDTGQRALLLDDLSSLA